MKAKSSFLTDILDALKLVVEDLSSLSVPSKAIAAAGILAPIIAAVAGVNITAPVLAADLAVAGTVAATLDRLFLVKKAKKAAAAARLKRAQSYRQGK